MERPSGVRQQLGSTRSKKREQKRERRQDARDRRRQMRAVANDDGQTNNSGGRPGGAAGGVPGQGGGGGSIRQTVPDLQNYPTLQPGTDFGQRFDALANPMLRANPAAIGRAWMMDAGLDPQAGGGATVLFDEIADAIPILHILSQTQGGLSSTSDAAMLDFAKMFLDQMTTPGGGVPNLAANIFSAGPDSGLSAIINDPTLDAAGQAANLLDFLRAGLGITDTGPVANAMYNMALSQSANYIAQQGRNVTSGQTFADYLRNNTGLDEWLLG